MSAILYVHIRVDETETTEDGRRDHVKSQVVRSPELTIRSTARADRLHVQVLGINTGIILRTHLFLRDQFEVSVTLVLLVGEEVYLVANLKRIGTNLCVLYRTTLHVVERVGEASEDGMIEDDRIEALHICVVAKLDRDCIQHMQRILAEADVTIAGYALGDGVAIILFRFDERRRLTHVTELHNRQIFVETTPSGELYVLTLLYKVTVEDQTICLQRDFSLRAFILFRIKSHITERLYYR